MKTICWIHLPVPLYYEILKGKEYFTWYLVPHKNSINALGRKGGNKEGRKEERVGGRRKGAFNRDRECGRKGGLGRKIMFSLRDIELISKHGFRIWSSRETQGQRCRLGRCSI